MEKSFYMILVAIAGIAVVYLSGEWIGRGYALINERLARQVHEAYGKATERYASDTTLQLTDLFRQELNRNDLERLAFRLDTVSLTDSITLRSDIHYATDYDSLLRMRQTFVYPISEKQGVRADILNPRAGSIGKLLYSFFGTLIGLVVLFWGIARQVKIIKRQDDLAQMREDFSYAMVHDMKTPLSSILMGTRILRSGKLDNKPEKKAKYFDIMEEEAQHLLALTNKVLTISKLEHGQLLLEKSWFPLRPMLEELIQLFSAKVGKQVSFRLEMETEQIYADEEYLKEAVSNLIDNAIKYSKESVDIRIATMVYDNYVQIKVKDNGIGISLAAQNHIFDKFDRGAFDRKGESNRVSGFGLGLNYVMNVTRSHGGYVGVESQEGKYSEFTLSIPLPTEEEEIK